MKSLCCSSVSVHVFRCDGERTGEVELLVGLNTSRDPRGSLGNDGLCDEVDGDFFKRSIVTSNYLPVVSTMLKLSCADVYCWIRKQ